MSGAPYPKASQLARGERRYRRKVASPKQWQAIIAAKRGPCRLWGVPSLCMGAVEYHHLVPRDAGGDDVADNIVPLCPAHHANITARLAVVLEGLGAALSGAERAYVLSKLGDDGLSRLFGAGRS